MIDNILNMNHRIQECLPMIQEIFIKYYGEEYRELITSKLQNCTYIGYSFPEDINSLLSQLYREKSLQYINEFFKENGIEESQESIQRYFGKYFNSLEGVITSNLGQVFNYLKKEEHPNYEKNSFLKSLKEISENPNIEEGSEVIPNLLKDLKQLQPSFETMLKKFEQIKDTYRPYNDYIEKCEELKITIREKYEKIYWQEVYEYLSEHDKQLLTTEKFFSHHQLDCYQILYGISYKSTTLLDSFNTKSNQKVAHPESTSSFELQSIYRDRVKYFKQKGIDLGDHYESYQNDERCISFIPNVDFVEKIMKIREELSKREKIEYMTSTSLYQEQLKTIESLELLDKDTGYNYNNLSHKITCISPNIQKIEDNIKLYCLLLFPMNGKKDYFDVRFIHECNHLIETELLDVKENNYKIRSGWETLKGEINEPISESENPENREKREFESLNEICNELLAQEVTEMFHQDGIYLFDNKETSKIRGKGSNSYERYRVLVQNFFDEFKREIIQSRITGNMEPLFQKIGEINFIHLNQLINDYANYFNGGNLYLLNESLREGKQNEWTLFYNECIAKRDQILTNMREQASNYSYNK